MTLLVALLLSAADPATSHQVSIPLEDYEKLRRQSERPALTVVDLLQVDGSFARRDLTVTLSGRAAGSWPTAEVLAADGMRLHSCEGEALLSRAESGAFAVTPLAQRFKLRCKVALDGSDRLAAQATGAVLEVTSTVADGELVASGDGEGRSFSVVRKISGAEQQALPPAVTGRYLVTLMPDEVRFAYRLEVRNPARGHRRFEVDLSHGEQVEQVQTQIPWDAEGGKYRFDLPPGETVLVLDGRLGGTRFLPPVQASLQYLLLESHPLIRPELTTSAKRVGVGETGLASRFRGAQAFLLDGEGAEVSWTVTRLQALKTAGLALHQLDQVFFLDASGTARGETTLSIDNQGAPSLSLPSAAQPTFASVGGEPAFLTHDKDGKLFLPLAQGAQEVVVQDARAFGHQLGFGVASLDLPRPGVPASRAHVQLRYPVEWVPIYEELPPRSRWHLPGTATWLALALLLALAERLLALAGLSRGRRWLLALCLALAAAFAPALRSAAIGLCALAWLALGAAAVVRRLQGAARVVVLLAGGAVVLVALLAFWAGNGPFPGAAPEPQSQSDYAVTNLARKSMMAPPAPAPAQDAVLQAQGGEAAGVRGAAGGYEGLPAKIEIPPGARQSDFQRELLATDAPRPVVVVMIASRVLSALSAAAVILLLAVAALLRRDLVAGGRALAGRLLRAEA